MGASKEHETVSHAKLACDQCEFTTLKDYLLNVHTEDVHNAVQFICDQGYILCILYENCNSKKGGFCSISDAMTVGVLACL